MRWYLHVDMDAFFVSVEQALNPSLKGKPVIVGGASGRGVVTSASYEARRYGVHSAMPAYQARRLCPQGVFLPNRHKVYSEFSHKVFAVLEHYSPEVHGVSIDEGLVNLTGTERLFGPPLKTADEIISRIKKELDLPASGGLSTSRVIAKVAATLAKPQGLIFVPFGSEKQFLSPQPVGVIPGVGPKTRDELSRRGIKTVAQLLEHAELKDRFLDLGKPAAKERAHDHSIGSETTLDEPLKDRGKMEEVLWELLEEVGSRLRQESWRARCITVKIRYTNFSTITRSKTLLTPTCFDREIFQVARELLQKNLAPGGAVRLLGVSASALQRAGWQEPIFDYEKRLTWERLYRGIDRLRRKYGDETIGSATPHTRSR